MEGEKLEKIINETFHRLKNRTEVEIEKIKENLVIYEENKINKEKIFITTILVNKDRKNDFKETFFPIVQEKNNEDFRNIEDKIYLEDVYLDFSYEELREINNKKYDAWLKIENENYNIKIKFEKDIIYLNKVKELYKTFVLNGIRWNTLNLKNIIRCYKVRIIENSLNITKEIYEKIKNKKYEIKYIFDKNIEKIIRNKEVLWNIEEKKIITTMFVKPKEFDVNYEYNLDFNENEKILIKNNEKSNILHCYKSRANRIKIIVENEVNNVWEIYKIYKKEDYEKILKINNFVKNSSNFSTNYIEMSFMDNLIEKKLDNLKIRSKAYIENKFLQYDFIKNKIELMSINFNRNRDKVIKIYNCNHFIIKDYDIFFNTKKVKLNLTVKIIEESEYIADYLSFLISEINLNIPEIECRCYLYGK